MKMFKSKNGLELTGVTPLQLSTWRKESYERYGIDPLQVAEAAGYSMAMVVRYALGLSAKEGRVFVVASDNLSGWLTLATLRHLVVGGAFGAVLLDADGATCSDNMARELIPLQQMEVPIEPVSSLDPANLGELFGSCHNVLWGTHSCEPGGTVASGSPFLGPLVTLLNEIRTPVHCVEFPYGLDPNSGQAAENVLYASSTLSLGAPLGALETGRQFIGRHYLCDCSFAPAQYQSVSGSYPAIFSEQPVQQLFATGLDTGAK